ncbi:hypothetical protein DPMN_138266 [Dreissena polymorpha]|uniref:Uncharacterized protein n=1 Tax=Dreissena polymorpha TaxID=45954 RepID=A0A9D4JFG2_DREPO|nr:hypothetical protein DPMN_138266 [Dreissena polymorpha]
MRDEVADKSDVLAMRDEVTENSDVGMTGFDDTSNKSNPPPSDKCKGTTFDK